VRFSESGPVDIKLAEWVKALLDALGSWKLWAFALLASLLILFIPKVAADFLGVATLRDQHRHWVGGAVVASFAGLAIIFLSKLVERIQRQNEKKSVLAELQSLSPEEKVVLLTYMGKQTKTLYFDITSGLTMGLVHRGILYRPTQVGIRGGFAFNLRTFVWEHLEKNPGLLKLPEGMDPRTIDIGEID
jgi:superinfection exclusion protein B